MNRTRSLIRRCALALVMATLLIAPRAARAGEPSPDGRWVLVTTPRSQTFGTVVLDPARRRLVEFSGETDGPRNSTRIFPLDAASPDWSVLSTAPGPMPGPRLHSSAVFDPTRDRMVIHGGFVVQAGVATVLSDTWVLDFAGTPTWSVLPTSSPGPQVYNAAAVYDPVRDRMLLFGGVGPGVSTEVWCYDFASGSGWVSLLTLGTPPSVRQAHAIAYDPVRDRMLVVGGLPGTGIPATLDVHALSLSGTPTWAQLAPTGTLPAGRLGHAIAYDDVADRLLVFGGNIGSFVQDTWQLTLGGTPAWSPLAPTVKPSSRFYVRGVFDPFTDRFVVTGGYDGTRTLLGGVWALQPDGSTWTALEPERGADIPGTRGTKVMMDPVSRKLHVHTRTMLKSIPLDGPAVWSDDTPAVHPVLDYSEVPSQDEVVVFDEQYRRIVSGVPGGFVRIIALDVSAAPPWSWSQVGPEGWLRRGASAVDVPRSRILSFGPDDQTFKHTLGPSSVTWGFWTVSGVRPFPRYHPSVAIDPLRSRMLVYGGFLTCLCDPGETNQIPAIQLGAVDTWIRLPVAAGPKPQRRKHALLVHDPTRDRMLMFGGADDLINEFAMGDGLSDCWELSLGGDSLRWRRLLPDGAGPPNSAYPRGIYDPVTDRLLLHAGHPEERELLFALEFSPATTATPPTPLSRSLRLAVGPNPLRAERARVQLTLPTPGRVRLELLDLAGRRVATHEHLGSAGPQSIDWSIPAELAPGVYHVRAQHGAAMESRRWVVMR